MHVDTLNVVATQDRATSGSVNLTAYPRTKRRVAIKTVADIVECFCIAVRMLRIKSVSEHILPVVLDVGVQKKVHTASHQTRTEYSHPMTLPSTQKVRKNGSEIEKA